MGNFLKICMVSPELMPYAKTGGLGDCVSSLAASLAQLGHEVKIVLPKYSHIQIPANIIEHLEPMIVNLGYGTEYCKVWEKKDKNLSVYFIEFDRYFNRNGIYSDVNGDFLDNHERFGFLSRAAIDLCYFLNWTPDIFHCHDWTSGLLPVMIDTTERFKPLGKAKTVFTIHNLQHHGYAPKNILDFLNIPRHVFRPDGIEAFGQVNMMKSGLYFSTKLTTVSSTYAQEIQTPQFGFGLDPVLKFRAGDLIGIRNGIDEKTWNPQYDTLIPRPYDISNLAGKSICKKALQECCQLRVDEKIPIFGIISRLYEQKGLDIFANIVDDLMKNIEMQIVILGAGDHLLEKRFLELSGKYPEKIFTYIGFKEQLSHTIEAGSDFFVMPSRFEPCGLNQMYSMKYATLPIVHATGGLKDTVINYSEKDISGTGFVFNDLTESALYNTIGWACNTFYNRKKDINVLQKNAMKQDFSWTQSAQHYVDVYKWAQK